MTTTIEARVRRGAALLDSTTPGWAEKINDEELDLGSCHECVLGQVFGTYERGRVSLDFDDDGTQIVEHGFDVYTYEPPNATVAWYRRSNDDVEAEYAALAAAWLTEIRARLQPPVDPWLPDPAALALGVVAAEVY